MQIGAHMSRRGGLSPGGREPHRLCKEEKTVATNLLARGQDSSLLFSPSKWTTFAPVHHHKGTSFYIVCFYDRLVERKKTPPLNKFLFADFPAGQPDTSGVLLGHAAMRDLALSLHYCARDWEPSSFPCRESGRQERIKVDLCCCCFILCRENVLDSVESVAADRKRPISHRRRRRGKVAGHDRVPSELFIFFWAAAYVREIAAADDVCNPNGNISCTAKEEKPFPVIRSGEKQQRCHRAVAF